VQPLQLDSRPGCKRGQQSLGARPPCVVGLEDGALKVRSMGAGGIQSRRSPYCEPELAGRREERVTRATDGQVEKLWVQI
jgi:hypothetical protein